MEREYTYYCNCCGCEFIADGVPEEDIECPDCGCTYDTGFIERYFL